VAFAQQCHAQARHDRGNDPAALAHSNNRFKHQVAILGDVQCPSAIKTSSSKDRKGTGPLSPSDNSACLTQWSSSRNRTTSVGRTSWANTARCRVEFPTLQHGSKTRLIRTLVPNRDIGWSRRKRPSMRDRSSGSYLSVRPRAMRPRAASSSGSEALHRAARGCARIIEQILAGCGEHRAPALRLAARNRGLFPAF